jgi:hypothetical protein
MSNYTTPDGVFYVAYGPKENCTLALCPVSASVYQYRPSIIANSLFIALFAISLCIHLAQGILWKAWFFASAMALGCVTEMVGLSIIPSHHSCRFRHPSSRLRFPLHAKPTIPPTRRDASNKIVQNFHHLFIPGYYLHPGTMCLPYR